jgi:hypothetical protein
VFLARAFANDIVSRLAPSDGGSQKAPSHALKLDTPPETIHAELRTGKARDNNAKLAFACQGKTIQVGARFCLLSSEKGNSSPLLCYLMKT